MEKARFSGKNIRNNTKSNKCAQSTIEYAMIIVCLVAALFAMRIYIKRSIQGRMREAADSIGEQYAPQHVTESVITITQTGTTTVKAKETSKPDLKAEGGKVFGMETTTTTNETTTKTGYEYLDAFEEKLFDK
jgi:hypothetical protein